MKKNSITIVKVISEWKKRPDRDTQQKFGILTPGKKMVMAIVEIAGQKMTRHMQV